MNEKELRKLISDKQKEMEEAQKAYVRIHYDRQIRAFADELSASIDLLELMHKYKLTADDARIFARMVAENIKTIFNTFAQDISANQARRKRKNDARTVRRRATAKAPVPAAEAGAELATAAQAPAGLAEAADGKAAVTAGPATGTRAPAAGMGMRLAHGEGAQQPFPSGIPKGRSPLASETS